MDYFKSLSSGKLWYTSMCVYVFCVVVDQKRATLQEVGMLVYIINTELLMSSIYFDNSLGIGKGACNFVRAM